MARREKPMRNLSVLGAALLISACAVGPDYQAPEPDAPDRFTEARDDASFDDQARRFWGGFQDPLLAELIGETLAANQDLQAALARLDQAEALLRGARADQYPTLSASGSAAEQYLAEVERTDPDQERVTRYQVGAAARWELDLFGRLRRARQARQAELEAAGADLNALQVALVGRLASSYFELRGLQQQLDQARHSVANQRESLAIVEARLDAGRATEFDRQRARARLDAIRATLPSLEAGVRERLYRIAVLAGRQPAALVSRLSAPAPLPESLPAIPVGSPGDALRRRPDIRAAERRLAAASARIGVATADLFPSFSLDALMGSVAADSSDLFSGPAESRAVALGVDWTFLDFGGVRSRIDAADAASRAALADYRQTVLEALAETETQLSRYQRAQVRTERLADATDSAARAARLARDRYEQGYIGYFEVLAAEQELIDTRDNLIESRTSETLAMVNIYRTLAGPPAGE
ncbi:MAG: RND transporter [Alcanivorax sp.]|nr:RND transporter [Alcanivorax sp.]MAY09936.1 RND transporter [Alcanivorax sp.]MBI56257.1 RND transporter [Alcanivorax sp.]HCE41845.1 RND transporter [Alcanivorax sp.]